MKFLVLVIRNGNVIGFGKDFIDFIYFFDRILVLMKAA